MTEINPKTIKTLAQYEFFKGTTFQQARMNIFGSWIRWNSDLSQMPILLKDELVRQEKCARKAVNSLISRATWSPMPNNQLLPFEEIPKLLHLLYLRQTGYFEHSGLDTIRVQIRNLKVTIADSKIKIYLENDNKKNLTIQYIPNEIGCCVWIGNSVKFICESFEKLAAYDFISLVNHPKVEINDLQFDVEPNIDFPTVLEGSGFYWLVDNHLNQLKLKINVKNFSVKTVWQSHAYHWLRYLKPESLKDIKIRCAFGDGLNRVIDLNVFLKAVNLDIEDENIQFKEWNTMQHFETIRVWKMDLEDLAELARAPFIPRSSECTIYFKNKFNLTKVEILPQELYRKNSRTLIYAIDTTKNRRTFISITQKEYGVIVLKIDKVEPIDKILQNPLCTDEFMLICAKYEYFKLNSHQIAYYNMLETRRANLNSARFPEASVIKELIEKYFFIEARGILSDKKYQWTCAEVLEVIKLFARDYYDEMDIPHLTTIRLPIQKITVTSGYRRTKIDIEIAGGETTTIRYFSSGPESLVIYGTAHTYLPYNYEDISRVDFLTLLLQTRQPIEELNICVERYNGGILEPSIEMFKNIVVMNERRGVRDVFNVKGFSIELIPSQHFHHDLLNYWLEHLEYHNLQNLKVRIWKGVKIPENKKDKFITEKVWKGLSKKHFDTIDVQDPQILINWSFFPNARILSMWTMENIKFKDLTKLYCPNGCTVKLALPIPRDFMRKIDNKDSSEVSYRTKNNKTAGIRVLCRTIVYLYLLDF